MTFRHVEQQEEIQDGHHQVRHVEQQEGYHQSLESRY